jgi:hypothetical protein
MKHPYHLRGVLLFLAVAGFRLMLPACAAAQADNPVSLGDLARSLRQSKTPSEPAALNVIDNDNLTQVIDDVEHFRQGGKPMFSFDSGATNFRMSSPDGTCSLSFNANATALLSTPYVSQDLPQSELAKLDGPANIHGDTLEISVYNASPWSVREITVGLTIVRRPDMTAANDDAAKLLPTVAGDALPTEKRSDSTLLLHLKGSTASMATSIYREKLDATLEEGQEWHWAIIEAKGIPPTTVANASQY